MQWASGLVWTQEQIQYYGKNFKINSMKISVGSKNPTKINAVIEAIKKFDKVKDAEVVSIDVNVETFGHPKTLDETIQGAMNRALAAFQNCDYSIGIEGGLMAVSKTKTGFVEIGACAIYDGKNYHFGFSPAYEWPTEVFDGIYNKGLDGSQAFKAAGLATEEKVGSTVGAIYYLTKGSIDRTEQNKQAVVMALIQIENPEIYY